MHKKQFLLSKSCKSDKLTLFIAIDILDIRQNTKKTVLSILNMPLSQDLHDSYTHKAKFIQSNTNCLLCICFSCTCRSSS